MPHRRPPATPSTRRPLNTRVREWLRRYGPAEAVGILTAVAGSYLAYALSGNEIAAAYGGTIGENVGFYGVILGRELWTDLRAARRAGGLYGFRGAAATGAGLMLEFGMAEVLDSGLIRPLAMGAATHYLGREVGVPLGKLAADVTFYIPVLCAYEWRRRTRDRGPA